jgi:hypothetical protein
MAAVCFNLSYLFRREVRTPGLLLGVHNFTRLPESVIHRNHASLSLMKGNLKQVLLKLIQGAVVNGLNKRLVVVDGCFSDRRFSLQTDSEKNYSNGSLFVGPPYSFRHVTRAETRSILSFLASASFSRDRLRRRVTKVLP